MLTDIPKAFPEDVELCLREVCEMKDDDVDQIQPGRTWKFCPTYTGETLLEFLDTAGGRT